MTKFKEYLRSKETEPEYDVTAPYNLSDFEINTCAGIETETEIRIMDGCIVAVIYSNIADPEYAVYDRYGEHGWFSTYGDLSCIERFNCSTEYTDWLYGTDYAENEAARAIMRYTYASDAKTRIAFKHMRAGIMDEEVFRKWHVKHCLEYMGIL